MVAPSGPPPSFGAASSPAPDPAVANRGRKAVRIGLILLAFSIVVGIFATVMLVLGFARGLDGPTVAAPGTTKVHLDAGTKAIYEEGYSSYYGITPADVTVTGPKGNQLTIRTVGGSQTLTINGTYYLAKAQFDADQAGDYTIEITGVEPTRAMVGTLVTDLFKSVAVWFFLALFCGLLLVIGFIVLIVGLVRRSRAKRPPGGPGFPPGPYGGPGYGSPYGTPYGTPGYPQPGYQQPQPGYQPPQQPGPWPQGPTPPG